MKVRKGFVSNSSSTAFVFLFKGESIFKMLEKYKTYFELYYDCYGGDKYTCTAEDVSDSIKKVLSSEHSDYDLNGRIIDVDSVINDEKKDMAEWSKLEEKNPSYIEYIFESQEKITKLEGAKKRGLDKALVINFGDNHGEVSGGNIGMAMDYEGRSISINKPDFIVYTYQCR